MKHEQMPDSVLDALWIPDWPGDAGEGWTLDVNTSRCFVTGSYRYGSPTEQSDIDLVVYGVSDAQALEYVGGWSSDYEHHRQVSLKFGKLNMIVCKDEKLFEAWRVATERAVKKMSIIGCKMMTKSYVKRLFRETFIELGIDERNV